jgi:hypothetical protein
MKLRFNAQELVDLAKSKGHGSQIEIRRILERELRLDLRMIEMFESMLSWFKTIDELNEQQIDKVWQEGYDEGYGDSEDKVSDILDDHRQQFKKFLKQDFDDEKLIDKILESYDEAL